jgi:hypothetical protein
MNYTLLIIPILLILAIYFKFISSKDPSIGYLGEHMINYRANPDYKVEEDRDELNRISSEFNRPMNKLCDLYTPKPGSIHNPPSFLDHDKEVWINSKLLRKKIRAIKKATEDKGTWEHTKMNTYIDGGKTTPYDTADKTYMENKSLDSVQRAIINPITTTFDFNPFSPKNPSAYSNVPGTTITETDYTKAPKNYYIFSDDYGFRSYK